MARRQSYIVVPNAIITAPGNAAAKRLLVALMGYSMPRRKRGQSLLCTTKSYEKLSQISGVRSDVTLHKSIRQLTAAGILKCTNHYAFCYERGRMERCKNSYALDSAYLCFLKDRTGYTLVPRALLTCDLTHTQFAIALLLYKLAGSCGVAWPSIRQIAATLRLAKSTVCLALRRFRDLQLFIRLQQKYAGRHGGVAYHRNRYCVTDSPFAVAQKRHPDRPKSAVLCNFPNNFGPIFSFNKGSPKNEKQMFLTG